MKNSSVVTVAVIGGGASGLAASVFAAREMKKHGIKARVAVFEANARIGKKLLVTGNGRCNFSNKNMDSSFYFGSTELVVNALRVFSVNDTVEFFKSGGVYPRADNAGRLYPMSNQASSVLDFFRTETERLSVEIHTDTKVTSLKKDSSGFLINNEHTADYVILACGGKAAPVHGSDGSVYGILSSLGIRYNKTYPALVPLCIGDFTKSLKGIRAEGEITVKQAGKVIARDRGELQYTEYGISGIPAMQVSGRTAPLTNGETPVFAYVDSAPSLTEEELENYILRSLSDRSDAPVEMLLSGIMPKRLSSFIMSELSFRPDKPIKTVNLSAVKKIVSAVKNKKYKISDVRPFNDAQVTSGGVPAEELNVSTLESNRIKRLYICGETVDVDGSCGGYNLQWAWSSAFVAAQSVVKEILNAQNQ